MPAEVLSTSAKIDQYESWSIGCQYIISVSALNGKKKSWVVKKTTRTLAEAYTGLIGTEWDAKRELFFASKGYINLLYSFELILVPWENSQLH